MTDTKRIVTEAAAGALADVLATQPWWKRSSNTVTAAATAIVTMGTWALTTELGLPNSVKAALGVLVAVAGVFATRATRNGATPRGDGRVLDAVIPAVVDAIGDGAGSLDRLVREQAEAAAARATAAATRAAQDAITAGTAIADQVTDLTPDAIAEQVKTAQDRLMRDVFGVGR